MKDSKLSPPPYPTSPSPPVKKLEEKPPLTWNELLEHFAASTTLHAIPNLVATDKKPLKYM